MNFSEQTTSARTRLSQSIPTMTSKLPICIGMRLIENIWSLRIKEQLGRTESTVTALPSATLTVKDFGNLERLHLSKDSNSNDTKLLSAPISNRQEA
ncbi:hypothetical protein Hdeb2414_s0032g00710891 [Helianthus debilis subsp. tardiflorus]